MPLGVAPTGLAGLFWPDGECAAARAATAAGTFYCASHGSACTLEDIAATGAAPRWMQVFVYRDRGFTREMVERAKAADYDALVLTIDNQLLGNRERDLRNGFTIPPRFGLGGTLAAATKAPWLLRMRSTLPRLTFGNYVRPGETAGDRRARQPHGEPARSRPVLDRRRLAAHACGPGRCCSRACCTLAKPPRRWRAGSTASSSPTMAAGSSTARAASLDALPAVVDAVAGRAPVLVDGGIRRGADVVKALALGAACCLIARPQLWGLAVAGEAGVRARARALPQGDRSRDGADGGQRAVQRYRPPLPVVPGRRGERSVRSSR